jgi:hypothetical protein
MAEAFHRAASQIVEHQCEISHHGDQAFWPAALLHRHAIELIIKEVIIRANQLLDRKSSKRPFDHNLEKHWNDARALIQEIDSRADDSWFVGVDEVIRDLHEIDRNGDAFRYAEGKGGKRHLSTLPRGTNIDEFSDRCTECFCWLSGTLTGINHEIDVMHEMNSYYSE